MTVDLTLKIREKLNMTLSEYAKSRRLDVLALRHIAYDSSKPCKDKRSKQYKVKKALIKDGFLDKKVLELEKRVTYKMRAKERRKIVARLRKNYSLSIKEFYEKEEDYFKQKKIDLSYLYVFLSGIGTGTKKGTKAFFINELLKKYPLLLEDQK